MFDLMKMLGKMKEVQAKMKDIQENLVHIKVTSEAGAGMVKVTVNGKKQLISLEIDDDIVNLKDKEMMRDLVIAATNKALEEADVKSKEEIKKHTADILPNIPGMDLTGMM